MNGFTCSIVLHGIGCSGVCIDVILLSGSPEISGCFAKLIVLMKDLRVNHWAMGIAASAKQAAGIVRLARSGLFMLNFQVKAMSLDRLHEM